MTEELTQELTPTPTPTAAPVVTPGPSPDNPDIFDPDTGKKWKERFHGAQGARLQMEAQLAEETGRLKQQISTLHQTLKERDAEIAALNERVSGLEEQTGQIPTLREQNQALAQQAIRADRYKLMMDFPNLLSMQVEQPAEGDDAGPVMVNPVLQLIESTSMPLEDLQRTIQQMAVAMSVQAEVTTRPAASTPAIPQSPPQQEGQGGTDGAWQRVLEAKAALNDNPSDPELIRVHQEAWRKYNESLVPEI